MVTTNISHNRIRLKVFLLDQKMTEKNVVWMLEAQPLPHRHTCLEIHQGVLVWSKLEECVLRLQIQRLHTHTPPCLHTLTDLHACIHSHTFMHAHTHIHILTPIKEEGGRWGGRRRKRRERWRRKEEKEEEEEEEKEEGEDMRLGRKQWNVFLCACRHMRTL